MTAECDRMQPGGSSGTVEPLWLPPPGEPPGTCAGRVPPVTDEACFLYEDGPALLDPPTSDRDLIRYRWMIGHQASFHIWQWLDARLSVLAHSDRPDDHAVREVALGYDCYSALLLYSGSGTAAQYEAHVRTSMRRHHPAFSGQWAPDHQRLPALCRSVLDAGPPHAMTPLRAAIDRNHLIHKAVADRLVPGGASLLRGTGRRPGTAPTQSELDCYDAYFGVRRSQVCRPSLVAQLVRRMAQIVRDVSLNGLYPWGHVTAATDSLRSAVQRITAQTPQLFTAAARLQYPCRATCATPPSGGDR
ncbi:hypothetical protein ACFQVC_11090 [Streptomyces monticola]|uniref:L-tyrosine 3-hydroxylase n=1 Tax=Streptomyces monticola TaxID=2666263 RepID=A0ABW2JHG4_9ACTN